MAAQIGTVVSELIPTLWFVQKSHLEDFMLSSAPGKCPFSATVGAEGNGGGRRRKLFHPAAPSPVPLPCSIHDFCTWDVQQILIFAAQSPLSSPAWSCLLLSCVLVCLFLIFINVFNAYKKDFSASLGREIHTCTVNHCFESFCQTPGGARGSQVGFSECWELEKPCS